MLRIEFQRCSYDPCVYYRDQGNDNVVYLFLYVDNMHVVSESRDKLKQLKKILNFECKMKYL